MTEAVAQHPEDQRQRPQRGDAAQAQHRSQRVHESFERNGDERERERQDESHAHLRRGRDPQVFVLQSAFDLSAQQCAGRKLILQQHFAHVGEARLDAREQRQHREGGPDHPHPHLVGQRADDREQSRDSQGLHQEQSHRDLDHDDHQRRDVGGAERADVTGAAHHLGHGPRDQREVDRRAADRNQQHQASDEELHDRRGR